jgi:Carboxypeptidase regulatory-like domain
MSPSAPRWQLTGTVTRSTGGIIGGATLEVIDGPNMGQRATSDASGRYSFSSLEQSGFSVRASAPDFETVTKGVGLTANAVVDFALARVLHADLLAEGGITSYPLPPKYGAWSFRGAGRNRGDGCAGGIAGTVSMLNGLDVVVATRAFTVPAATIVHPRERFEFTGCCFSTAELDQTTFHQTEFTFKTVSCP